jgi:hypothetical protein
MSTTEIVLFLGLAALVIATQVGRHTLSLHRLALPLLTVGLVGWQYLQSIPTRGGSLDFVLCCAAFGVLCGLLAASLVRIERDSLSGRVMTSAGVGYAVVWLVVLGGRLAFGYLAQHGWSAQVRQFSIDHALTVNAWTAAFVMMALAMVVARTASIGLRALRLSQGGQFVSQRWAA